jgi:hypothetical protein
MLHVLSTTGLRVLSGAEGGLGHVKFVSCVFASSAVV